jgi:hypothetical protein
MDKKQNTMALKVRNSLHPNHNETALKIYIGITTNHNESALPVGKDDGEGPQPNESVLKEQNEPGDAQYQTTLKFDKSLIRKQNETTLKIK